MRIRSALICCAALTIVCVVQRDASAQPPVGPNRLTRPTTILPSRQEIAAVPIPQRGRVAAFPVDVVRYGLTIHPGSRIVRGMFGR